MTARAREKKGIISNRCALNRQIKADNALLRELKSAVRKLMDAVKNTIPALAEAMEKLRENMIFFRFQLNHIANEWYAKDTSKKIRAVFRAKGLSGKRLSTQVPYGYLMGENGQLIEDTETAPVVRLIFRLAIEGDGPGKIARILREKQIITPGTLIFQRTGRTDRYNPEFPCHWNSNSVGNILEQKDYLGNTYNFKTTKKSYKSKKTICNPEKNRLSLRIPMWR